MGPIRAKSERSSSSVPSYRLPMKTVRNRLPAAHASGELLRRDSDQLLQPRLLLRLRLRLRLLLRWSVVREDHGGGRPG